jgi:hypothetical protein
MIQTMTAQANFEIGMRFDAISGSGYRAILDATLYP